MNFREEFFNNKDKTWLIFTPPPQNTQFSELVALADWYNNQILYKAVKNKKMTLKSGEKTLLSASPLLPTTKLVVFGTGDVAKSDVQKIALEAKQTVSELQVEDPWVLVSNQIPEELAQALKKTFSAVIVG